INAMNTMFTNANVISASRAGELLARSSTTSRNHRRPTDLRRKPPRRSPGPRALAIALLAILVRFMAADGRRLVPAWHVSAPRTRICSYLLARRQVLREERPGFPRHFMHPVEYRRARD